MSEEQKQQIDLLQKALEREKKARQQLEAKIEQYDSKQFEINQELLTSYESARIREVQLQFLAFLSKNNIDDKSLNEISLYFADNIASLFAAANCLIYKRVNGEMQAAQIKHHGQDTWQNLTLEQQHLIKLPYAKELNKWQRLEFFSKNDTLKSFNGNPALVISFQVKDRYQLVITLIVEHYCYSNDFKDTLQIAANQFASIISKRLTDAELSFNYQKLKKTVKTLRSTQRQLLHAEKMASLGTLSAGVAHEINNPLSYLASNLDTLEQYIEDISDCFKTPELANIVATDKTLAYVLKDLPDLMSACTEATERISSIVSGLNSFSRKNDEQLIPINIKEPIEAAIVITHNALKYKHQVELQWQHNDLQIAGNQGQLQQVFTNLLINAAHAMPEGGVITISTWVNEDNLAIKVCDQGEGMDEKTAARIFEPFYTTKPENQGTGLGLSISYAILSAHNASISVKSKLKQGTCFTILIPAI